MNIFVGNLNYRLSEEELQALFAEKGEVTSVKIIMDRYTGRSREKMEIDVQAMHSYGLWATLAQDGDPL